MEVTQGCAREPREGREQVIKGTTESANKVAITLTVDQGWQKAGHNIILAFYFR